MPSLNIPNRHVSGLVKLFNLTEKDDLIENLRKVDISINPEKSIREAVASITGFTSEDVNDITRATMSLLLLRSSSDKSLEELIDELISTIKKGEFEELKFSDERYAEVKEKLIKILSIENLLLSAKAVGIKFEHDNLFEKAKVLTQILPVFSDDVDEIPKAAIIAHQLGVHYFQDGDHKEFFLRIDEEEIEELIKMLERAKKKARSLQNFLITTDIKYIENV